MALTKSEIKQYVQDIVLDDRGWNWTQWDNECHRLSVHVKYAQQLADLEIQYEKKLRRLYLAYQELYDQLKYGVSESFITATSEDAIADLRDLKNKFRRIALKWNTVKAEIRGRSLGFFNRTPVGTTYYIDLDGGNDGNDGLSTGQAWLTIEQYITITVRSAGDIAYVRANTDEVVGAVFNVDESGNANNQISIIGCDSVINDPWSDGSDVKPIIGFGDNAYYMYIRYDNFWYVERMVWKELGSFTGMIYHRSAHHWHWKDCEFIDNSNATGYGLNVTESHNILLESCILKDNLNINLKATNGSIKLKNCTLDGGVTTTDYGIENLYIRNLIECIDCDFGQTTEHDVDDIKIFGGKVILRNCKLGTVGFNIDASGGMIFEEDADGVKGAQKLTCYQGTVTKDTGVTRVGGADSSAKFEPNSNCGLYQPLTMVEEQIAEFPFRIWCAAALTTITIYIRSLGVWGTYPTVDELYLEANYLDQSAGGGRATVVTSGSMYTLSDETTWIPFSLTIFPTQEGFVYLNVYLKKFEANKGCYVDIKPVVS